MTYQVPLTARSDAEEHVHRFTLAAMATGAIPVPGASLAIVAENAALLNAVAAAYGIRVTPGTVVASLGPAAAANVVGRTVFVEADRALGWFGGPGGALAISGLGATTAGLQTWCLGQLAIAICESGGAPLAPQAAYAVLEGAKASFATFRRQHAATAANKRPARRR